MKTLTEAQVNALLAFLDAFEQTITGVWPGIDGHMRVNWGIDDPEAALEEAINALHE